MENSIEENIEILENFINWLKTDFEYNSDDEIKVIEHILSDYKRVLKENEKYQKWIQKVKDKIEFLDNQQKQWLEDRKLKVSDSEIIFARDFLQELLEGGN